MAKHKATYPLQNATKLSVDYGGGERRRVSYASDTTDNERKSSILSGQSGSRKSAGDISIQIKRKMSLSEKQMEINKSPLIYKTSDVPPVHLLLLFGFQQALLAISGSLAIVLIAAKVTCAEHDGELQSQMLSSTMFVNGISTFLMVSVGSRLPLYQGAYGGYIVPLMTLMEVDPTRCDVKLPANTTLDGKFSKEELTNSTDFNLRQAKKELALSYFRELQGCLMIVGVIHFLIGATGLIGVLLRFIGPVTVVPTILLLGIYFVDPVVSYCVVNWGITWLTFGLGFLFAFYLAKWPMPFYVWTRAKGWHVVWFPFHQVFAILLSIIIAWLVSWIITEAGGFTDNPKNLGYMARTDARLSGIAEAKAFFFPYPGLYGMVSFRATIFVGFLIATFISILDSIGDYYACAAMSHVPPPPAHAMNRGIAVEGLCTIIAGALGAPTATTTYGGNIGAIGITRVASRSVFMVVAAIYVVLALLGKLSAVFISIPYPVLGGSLLVMMGMFMGVVLSNLKEVDLQSSRNLAIMGTALLVGLVVPNWVKNYPDDISTGNEEADFIIKGLLGNPNFTGGIIACLLDNTIPGTKTERGISAWQSPSEAKISALKNVYEEGYEIYELWMPEKIKMWKIWKYVPFMPSNVQDRQRSLSDQWARRKSIVGNIPDLV
ncbi:hypothetical protein KUTeg_004820 [Tegillarca granosa]|uniref:Uncharacterized protein n=1 Tax=Tegillarca granosa TaxID=220873 RepID=A0ABQ9FL78_TEGGR|nr:hypothetical protein KUTeg_004820 [Tegillarca granosa]